MQPAFAMAPSRWINLTFRWVAPTGPRPLG